MKTIYNIALLGLGLASAAQAQSILLDATELGNPTTAQLLAGYTTTVSGVSINIVASGDFDSPSPTVLDTGSNQNNFSNRTSGGSNTFTFTFTPDASTILNWVQVVSGNNLIDGPDVGGSPAQDEVLTATLTGGTWGTYLGGAGSNANLTESPLGGTEMVFDSINNSFNTASASDPDAAPDFFGVRSGAGVTGLTVENQNDAAATFNQPFAIRIDVSPVPEPSSTVLFALGGLGLLARRKR